MSFSTSHTNVMTADDIKVETLGTDPTPRHLEQFEAGKKAAVGLIGSGVCGEGPFVVGIYGHAGNATGNVMAGDSVGLSICKAYPVEQK